MSSAAFPAQRLCGCTEGQTVVGTVLLGLATLSLPQRQRPTQTQGCPDASHPTRQEDGALLPL